MKKVPDIYDRSLEQVKKAVLDAFKDEDVIIMLFGSRAREDSNRCSDIDIGILPKNKTEEETIKALQIAL